MAGRRWLHCTGAGLTAFILLLLPLLSSELFAQGDKPQRQTFEIDGHKAFLLVPDTPAQTAHGKPWVWYAPTLGNRHPDKTEQWMFDRLHAKGIAVAGIDVGESMGNPEGRAAFQKLYVEMTEKRGYSTTPVLLGRSRGGLMLYNWAVEHPESVGAVAGIYPVCNLASWPGLAKAAPAYGKSAEELEQELDKHNPVDRLATLAKAKVPIMHLHGDNDRVVPMDKNSALLAERYKALGGSIKLEVIEGGGHDMKRHWFESQTLTDFMIDHALGGGKEEAKE